jgi:hypothetical protein
MDSLEGRAGADGGAAALAAGMGIWSYYGATPVPYTPSYNLLTLACALASSALSLRLGRAMFRGEARGLLGTAFLLGGVASMGIATKFTAGALVLVLDGLIVALLGWRRIDVGTGWRVALAISAGLLTQLALLAAVDHELGHPLPSGPLRSPSQCCRERR